MFKEDCFEIGYLAKPHGIDGQVILRLNSDFAEEIDEKGPFFLEIRGLLVPFFIERIQPSGDMAYVKFEFISSREEAMRFAGVRVYSEKKILETEEMPDPSVFTGYFLQDKRSGRCFEITAYIDHPDNPLFVVSSENDDYYVPLNPELISDVDHDKKILIMELPDGLFD